MGEKALLQSKMVWVGIITVILSALAELQGQEFIVSHPGVVSAIGLVIGLLTVVLRFFTNQPIKRLGGRKTP